MAGTTSVGRKSEAHSATGQCVDGRRNALRCSALLMPLLLAACGGDLGDPYKRPYTWEPGHVNESNLQAMVADPHDLVAGRSGTSVPSQGAALAVARLRADRVKPLPDSGLAKLVISGAPQAAPAGGD
jgi:hypothetical protein